MTSSTIRWLIVGAAVMHGLGMVGGGGFLAFGKTAGSGFGVSWLLGGGPFGRVAALVLWGVAGVAYVAAGVGFMRDAEWWRTAAWIGAPGTLASVALWAGAVPPGTYAGAAFAVGTIAYMLR